jgi:hypothetical protein
MRGLLVFSCRAFPPDHRARNSDEVVDTAMLAADGSSWRTAREAASLVVAGARQRLRAESSRSLRDGCALLAGVLALVNLAVAVAGIVLCVHPPRPAGVPPGVPYELASPYAIDWWWIAFAVAAAGIVLGLVLGNRLLAAGAAFANLGLVGYDAIYLADNSLQDGRGNLDVFTKLRPTLSYPAERQWLSVAIVLVLATAAAPRRRLPLRSLLLALAVVVLLVVLSRETAGGFFFLRWPLIAIVVLGIVLGSIAPRLAVLALGVTVAAAPSTDTYLTMPGYNHHALLTPWVVVAGLALGVLIPLAQLTRRQLGGARAP